MKIMSRLSIVAPVLFVVAAFTTPLSLSVPEIGLFLDGANFRLLIVIVTIIWLSCSPLRKSCCNGSFTEILFNFVPIELIMLLSFAQWHFVIAVMVSLVLIIGETVIFVELRKDEHKHRITKRRHRKYQVVFQRVSVIALTVVFCLPCLLTICIHGIKSPEYEAQQEIIEFLFFENDDSIDTNCINENIYDKNNELWSCFEENRWKRASILEKISIIQKLVDFESDVLGVPTIPVTAGMIGALTLGAYDNETNEMWINTEHLADSPIEECIRTVCHETFHSQQYYLVKTIDWDNPAFQTAYFKQLRDWMENAQEYKSAWVYGFSQYENQPLEVTAREYAENETKIIMEKIESL